MNPFRRVVWLVLPLLLACNNAAPLARPIEPTPELLLACQHLFENRVAYENACPGFGASPSVMTEKVSVDSCVGIALGPGSLLLAEDIDACATQLGTLQCTWPSGYPSCAGYSDAPLFPNHDKKGSALIGQACFAQFHCESGYCSGSGSSCGRCQRPRVTGESCALPDDVCIEGLCLDGTCGDPSRDAEVGQKCIHYGAEPCGPTMFCDSSGQLGADGVCVARGETGAPCNDSGECVSTLFCTSGACTPKGADGTSCIEYDSCQNDCMYGVCGQRKLGIGVNEDCTYDVCGIDLRCEGNVCVPYPYLPKGASCNGTPDQVCESNLVCDLGGVIGPFLSSSVCAEPPKPGEACTGYGICEHGSMCIGFNVELHARGTCKKLGLEDEPCPCGDSLACVHGTCVPFGVAVCY